MRAIGYGQGGRLRLASRNGRDITPRYPELRELGRELGSHEAVLDGEVVAFGPDGRPSFQRLQSRMHLTSETLVRRLARTEPVAYVIFDLLWLDGHSLMGLEYRERRERLLELGLNGPTWQTPAHHVGDGAALLEATRAQRLEGIIAKRLDSPYTPGRRSPAWVKVKNYRSTDVVIGGWLPGEGNRQGRLGALVVGYYDDDGGLRYAGPRRDRLRRARARPAGEAAGRARARGLAVRRPPAAEAGAVRRARPRLPGRVLGVDAGQHAAPAVLQGPARRRRPALGARAGRPD